MKHVRLCTTWQFFFFFFLAVIFCDRIKISRVGIGLNCLKKPDSSTLHLSLEDRLYKYLLNRRANRKRVPQKRRKNPTQQKSDTHFTIMTEILSKQALNQILSFDFPFQFNVTPNTKLRNLNRHACIFSFLPTSLKEKTFLTFLSSPFLFFFFYPIL